MIYSCFDIGGTAVKYGLIDETGRFHKKGSVPTQTETAGGPGLVHKVLSLIQRQLADNAVAGATAGICSGRHDDLRGGGFCAAGGCDGLLRGLEYRIAADGAAGQCVDIGGLRGENHFRQLFNGA